MAQKTTSPPNPDPWAPPLLAAGTCRCGGRGVLWTFAWPRRGEAQHWVARRCWWCQPRPEFREEPTDGSCDYCLGCSNVKARFFQAGLAKPFGEIVKLYHCPVCGDGELVEHGKNAYGAAYVGLSAAKLALRTARADNDTRSIGIKGPSQIKESNGQL